MPSLIVSALVGVLCIVMGAFHMKGNLSTLHFYHRHRVSEQDRLPFGKLVGLGTIIIGVAIIVFGILLMIGESLERPVFASIGTGVAIVGTVVGLVLSFYAMIKYNKGIF